MASNCTRAHVLRVVDTLYLILLKVSETILKSRKYDFQSYYNLHIGKSKLKSTKIE